VPIPDTPRNDGGHHGYGARSGGVASISPSTLGGDSWLAEIDVNLWCLCLECSSSSASPGQKRSRASRPVLAWAGGLAIVAVVAVPVSVIGTGDDIDQGDDLGAAPTSPPAALADALILVVFFSDGLTEPPVSAVESLRALPQVTDLLVVDRTRAEAEIRQGMIDAGLPEDEPMWSDGPGIPATVRLRVETDHDVETVAEFAAALDDVVHSDAYLGSIDDYPAWRLQTSTEVDESVATTTSVAPVEPNPGG